MVNKLDQNKYITINEEFLEKKFNDFLPLLKQSSKSLSLSEHKIQSIINLYETINVDLSAKKRLIIVIQILFYINDEKTTNDNAMNKLFEMFGEKRDDNLNVAKAFNKFIRKLPYTSSSIKEIKEILNDLSREISDSNQFQLLFEQITNETKKLINQEENVRNCFKKIKS